MKTIYLLRHAKSDWANAQLSDHERPLNARGRKAARRMGRYFRDEGLRPDRVLISSAVRTRETWQRLSDAAGLSVEPEFHARLYHAAPSVYLEYCRRMPAGTGSVLLIGHSPGIEETARMLSRSGAEAQVRALQVGYPTGALVEIRINGDWGSIGEGGRLVRYIRPRLLTDD